MIQSGDKVYLTQYQETGSKGGLILIFTDGSSSGWNVKDQDGYWLNDDQKQNATHVRIADLSGLAGKRISQVVLNNESDTTPGSWNIYYDNISFVGVDGSVKPIYTGQTSSPISSISGTSGETGLGSTIDTNTGKATHPSDTTTYYTADHLGSSRLLTSGTGYPIWSGVFLPYGQEFSPQITMNNYKFTGDEHDAESNLEHTMYRQYEAVQGRWLSPDPAGMAAVDLTNPQSLNIYAYVSGNPLNAVDPLGLKCVTLDNGVVGDDGTEPPCGDDMTPGNGEPDATVNGGGASGYATGIGFDPGSYCIIYGCGGYSKNGGVTNFPMTGPSAPPDLPPPAPSNPCNLNFRQRAILLGNGVLNLASAGTKIAAAGAVEAGSSGILTGLALYGVYSAAGNLTTGLIQTVGAFAPNAGLYQQAASVSSAAGSISGLATLAATNGNVVAATHASRFEGFAQFGLKGGLGKVPSPLNIGTTANAAGSEASSGEPNSRCHF